MDVGANFSKLEVYALRPDWMVYGAWKKAFETFLNNNKEEMDALASNGGKARWQDFRVDHGLDLANVANAELDGVMFDAAGTQSAIQTGEFVLSRTHNEAGAFRTFTWGAAGGSSFSILAEYANMANTPANPSTVSSTAAYQDLDDDTQSNGVLHLSGAGNEPPYDALNLEQASPFVKVAELSADASGAQVLSTGFFEAPCGIFLIRTDLPDTATNSGFFLEAKAGTYKGVAAETMGTSKLVMNHYEVK